LLAWWIWASQVIYNVRFRQKDWLHLSFALLQLFTFCALSAFSSDVKIVNRIVPEKKSNGVEKVDYLLFGSLTELYGSPDAERIRGEFIARVNGTGTAGVMAASRVVLLLQYARGETNLF
jgi:hypothetical protein